MSKSNTINNIVEQTEINNAIADARCQDSIHIGNMLACNLARPARPKSNDRCKYSSSAREVIEYGYPKPKKYYACCKSYFMR